MPKQSARVRRIYECIAENQKKFSVKMMCRLLHVSTSGFYAWLKDPVSNRAQDNARLLRLIRASFAASHGIYGAPRVFLDLREAGETCSKHRVARLMRENNIRASPGYRTKKAPAGKLSAIIPNLLQRQFTVTRPNIAWVTDITYIRTWQGWLYLAAVMDLFSRKVIGWATSSTIDREVVLDAILMAVRARRPRQTIIHSDQGTQYGSDAWRRFCKSNHLEPSMSRRGNCWDNAVAESFFSSLKKERIKKLSTRHAILQLKIYRTTSTDSIIQNADIVIWVVSAQKNLRRRQKSLIKVSAKSWELQFQTLVNSFDDFGYGDHRLLRRLTRTIFWGE